MQFSVSECELYLWKVWTYSPGQILVFPAWTSQCGDRGRWHIPQASGSPGGSSPSLCPEKGLSHKVTHVRDCNFQESQNKHCFSASTSICHIELDPKVSTRASGVVTSCKDDPTYGLDLPDDAGDSRGGQEAIVADNQATNLQSTDFNEERCLL